MSADPPEPWPGDGWADAMALVEVVRRDDEHTVTDMKAVLRHANLYDVALTLAKCLAEVLAEQKVDAVHFRRWSADAVRRP